MKKQTLIILFGLAVVASIFFAVLTSLPYSTKNTDKGGIKTASPVLLQDDKVSQSNKYIDSQSRFSFQYPVGWGVRHDDTLMTDGDRFDRNFVQKKDCLDNNGCPTIMFGIQDNPKSLSIEKYIAEEMQWKIDGGMQQKSFGTKTGTVFSPVSDFDGTSPEATWVQIDNTHFLTFTTLQGGKDDAITVYQGILTSLEYLK